MKPINGNEVLWAPNSRAQWDFLAATEFEALMGGSKGGGKSRALVVDALRYIEKSSYKALILRRTYPRLRELCEFASRIYPHVGGIGTRNNTEWRFPSGAQILFSHLQHEKDVDNFQGQQFQGIFWDELCQFTQKQYETMRSCCRSEDPSIPCRMRATANPGGIGHAFVKEYFIDRCPAVSVGPAVFNAEFQVTWQPQQAGPAYRSPEGMSRRFYPAKVFDNLDLLKANPIYVKILKELPMNQRKAYLEGDWTVFEGQYFPEFNELLHVRPPRVPDKELTDEWGIPHSWPRFGGIDYGSANPWAAVECATDPSNGRVIIYRTIAAKGWTHEMQAQWLKGGSKRASYVADDACFYRGNENDSKIRQVSDAELWAQHGFCNVSPASKGRRVPGWAHVRQYLRKYDETSAWLEILDVPGARGRYGLITVFPKMMHSEKDPEDMESDCPDEARDDVMDCLRYALLSRPCPTAPAEKPRRPYAPGDWFSDTPPNDDDEPIEGTVVGNW